MNVAAYYNEIDTCRCGVLRRRIAAGDLPIGVVDERDIREVQAGDVGEGQAHFFAGIGGWPMAQNCIWKDLLAVARLRRLGLA